MAAPRSLVREVAKSKARRVDPSLTAAELATLPDDDLLNLKLAAEHAYIGPGTLKERHPYQDLACKAGIELLNRGHKQLDEWGQIQEDMKTGIARVS